jgi:hypothetical protein
MTYKVTPWCLVCKIPIYSPIAGRIEKDLEEGCRRFIEKLS